MPRDRHELKVFIKTATCRNVLVPKLLSLQCHTSIQSSRSVEKMANCPLGNTNCSVSKDRSLSISVLKCIRIILIVFECRNYRNQYATASATVMRMHQRRHRVVLPLHAIIVRKLCTHNQITVREHTHLNAHQHEPERTDGDRPNEM